jgi:hypothetical protein
MQFFQQSSPVGLATRPISLRLAPCPIEQLKAFTVSGTLTRVARELILTGLAGGDNKALAERLCVQRRLACSAGDRPAGAKVRRPVVWIAGWRETKTTVNVQVASKVSGSEGRASN